jgi:hypothetical protein
MKTIEHRFVEFIPEQNDIENGVIYISLEYDTVVHNCLCGCRQQVITPLSPTDWKLTYDGETITLFPSIGNWNFRCKSHYWIKKSEVQWSEQWSQRQIDAGRKQDAQNKETFFNEVSNSEDKSLIERLKVYLLCLLGRSGE